MWGQINPEQKVKWKAQGRFRQLTFASSTIGPAGRILATPPAIRPARAGGRDHVTARGNERKPSFRDDADPGTTAPASN